MYSVAAILIFWLIVSVAIATRYILFAVSLAKMKAKELHDAKVYADEAKKAADDKYNKYAVLSVTDLHNVLSRIFSVQLELASAQYITDVDSDAVAKLYGYASSGVLNFLGADTIRAIERYHGDGFVLRWCEVQFRLLENSGILRSVIGKERYSDTLAKNMEIVPEKEKGKGA